MSKTWNILGRVALALPLLALAVLGFAPRAQAADFREGEVVIIPADEVIDDDLFVFGQRVEVYGTITGDLFAMGQEVIVDGTVEGSLFIAGQETEMNGTVGGSVYGGAYTLVVGPDAAIGRNLYFGGYNLETEPGGTLGRSLYMGGYQGVLGGQVDRDVRASLAALELNGRVGGDVVLEVGETDEEVPSPSTYMPNMPVVQSVAPGVRLGPDAEVGGNLWYQSVVAQSIPAGAVGGEVTFATPVPPAQPDGSVAPVVAPSPEAGVLGNLFVGFSRRVGEFIALVIVGGLLLRFWPEAVQRVGAQAQERPLRSAGYGLLVTVVFFVAVPLAAIAIFAAALLGGLITFGQLFSVILGLGAAALGLTVTAGMFILSLVTKAIVSYMVGRLVLSKLAPQALTGAWAGLLSLALGAGIYEILRAIPLGLGWAIGTVVTLLGVGAMFYVVRAALRRAAPLAAPPAAPVAV